MIEDLAPASLLAAAGPAPGRARIDADRGADRRRPLRGPPGGAAPRRCPRGSDIAVVLFTSGSTGNPKAVLHSHRGLAYKAASMVAAHGLTADDVALMPSPLAHVSGLLNSVLVPGQAAMRVVLMEKWDAERAVRLAGEHGASFMIGPPTLFVGMMDVPGYRAQVERPAVVSCGSMGVTPEFIDAAREGLGAMVKRTYGSTEAPTVTTSSWRDTPDQARDTDGHSVGAAEIRVAEPGTTRAVAPGAW